MPRCDAGEYGVLLVEDASHTLSKPIAVRESFDLESCRLPQRTVAESLERRRLEPHLEQLNAVNRRRRDALLTALYHRLGCPAART